MVHSISLEQAEDADEVKMRLFAGYAQKSRRMIDQEFSLGEGLVGQCATEKER